MKIATVLFVYNRYKQAYETLQAIGNSKIKPTKLFIFQDGLKENTDDSEWKLVNKLIQTIDFCPTEVHFEESNRGLAYSVKNGITNVMENYDAAIIFEDDCVPHPLFIEYATNALIKYEKQKQVWSINGYANNVNVEPNGYDTYFIGRTSSWGWATWKDRWNYYIEDYTLLRKIKNDKKLFAEYKIWGEDLENYVLGNIQGRCDSWAVFWSLQVIYRGGYCLTPYKSLIRNIGLDGSGTHSGDIDFVTNYRDFQDMREISFPDKVEFPVDYRDAYSDCFHWIPMEEKNDLYKKVLIDWVVGLDNNKSISELLRNDNIYRISIWGSGELARLLINEIKQDITIVEIIKSSNYNREKEFCGIKICDYSRSEIDTYIDAIIVIPFFDLERIKKNIRNKKIKRVIGLDEIIRKLKGNS